MAELTSLVPLLLSLTLIPFLPGVASTTFTILNKCDYTVWPGILSNAGVPPLPTTGFVLQKGESQTITAPRRWGGRFWGRTQCTQDSAGNFSCFTGDCASGKLECAGRTAAPPATLAEFTLSGAEGLDFFDVSLVDGYNLPMLVVPQGTNGQNCTNTGCVADLNDSCPSELKVMNKDGSDGIACRSACDAFQSPQYCCSGPYASPSTCKPSSYSRIFKKACPSAYSYAYDDETSTFTCDSADYAITFCPSPTASKKSSSSSSSTSETSQAPPVLGSTNPSPLTDGAMVYDGGWDENATSPSTRIHVSVLHALAGFVGIAVSIWQLSHQHLLPQHHSRAPAHKNPKHVHTTF